MLRVLTLALSALMFTGCIKIEIIPIKYAPVGMPQEPEEPEELECSTQYSMDS